MYIDEIKDKLTKSFPELTYCGKDYTVADLLKDLEAAQKCYENAVDTAWLSGYETGKD